MLETALNNSFMKCDYKNEKMGCIDLFHPMMTDAGSVLSFPTQLCGYLLYCCALTLAYTYFKTNELKSSSAVLQNS